jgi:glycosyltransferase involved in cell wall biosynthesis
MSKLHQEQHASTYRAGTSQPLIVCAVLGLSSSWQWFAPIFNRIRWKFYGGNPRNWLERKMTRPALGSWRSCWESVQFARRRNAALLISHDGRVSSRAAVAARLQKLRVPHVAWGFNFTTLPEGAQRRLMTWAFSHVDRFVVYSTAERSLYADYFGIDPRRIDVVLWGVASPQVDSPETPVETPDYICTLGGNARDYRTLFAAMEKLPDIPLVAVLRPENAAGLKVPPNVRLHYLIPAGKANNILAFSRFTVVPLAGDDATCGHVTIVSAMYLKKAMVVTNSLGVSDYVQDGVNSLLVPAGDPETLAERIRELWNNPQRADQLGAAGLAFAQANCSEQQIIDHLKKVLMEYGLPA